MAGGEGQVSEPRVIRYSPSLLLAWLPDPASPPRPPAMEELFHQTGPWCQKGWAALWEFTLNQVMQQLSYPHTNQAAHPDGAGYTDVLAASLRLRACPVISVVSASSWPYGLEPGRHLSPGNSPG